jgi:hypothetical protein
MIDRSTDAVTGEAQQTGNFRRFWVSRVLAQTAQSALLYGLLIVLVDRTSSSIYASLFVVASIVPALLLGLPGGVLADWLPQRALLVVLNMLRVGAILLVIRGDFSVRDVFVVTVAIWVIHQFYSPAESALLPALVERERLSRATSLHNLALSIAQLLGMVMLAPLVLKLGDIQILLSLCAALYLAAGVALLRVRAAPRIVEHEGESLAVEAGASLLTGWRIMARDRYAFGALVDSVMVGIGLSALVVIVPQFLETVLDTAPDNTVFVFAPAALGLVIGLQAAPLLGALGGFGRLAAGGLALFAGAILAIGSVAQISEFLVDRGILVGWIDETFGIRPIIATTMLLSIPAGFAVGLVNVAIRTELVLRTPPESHARVFATQATLANLGALVPTLAAGLLIDLVGVRPVAVIVALGLLAGAVFARRIGGAARLQQGEAQVIF